ncbi:cytidine and deoxycytidylate deaminase family protein [Cryptosporidium ubiquitum]|uniref:Cytidine and deoxycytidylate deaminase family protein n=1 Tax=Cryptosporidium ubiquitum TaxID=857276 RepID=A0A1J4MBX8_9CRYT|nr:cytidine and deoxycytidylate deaminase family protein [Cryptosporidium ubiquitum]OII71736.1 cytidine and deoxycytidylate deaminase family protein [Cryptosporidium ubiquitum]
MSYNDGELKIFMNRAIELSKWAASNNEVPVGCVIVNRITKKIESEAHNETNISRNGTRHCEIVALEKLINKLNYMNREFSNSTQSIHQDQDKCNCPKFRFNFGNFYDLFVTVEPCIMCIGFIDQLGINKIFFGCKNYRFGGCGSVLDYHHLNKISKITLTSGICENETIKILKDFYESGNPKAPENKRKRPLKILNCSLS